ncbi:MAG: sigma-70 family RNA polymerase sigma factor [Solirubrobacterales bacterium]|nr:sigma-70 family RNA polymerase sigma factor [Solirubrobacterales bacterium]
MTATLMTAPRDRAEPESEPPIVVDSPPPDPAGRSRDLHRRLTGSPGVRRAAISELRDLLLAAARHEVNRRLASSGWTARRSEREDLAQQSADDALLSILGKLDEFRGESRFTTWAWKFALFEAGVKVRRRSWQGREIPLEQEAWSGFRAADGAAEQRAEDGELLAALREEIEGSLTSHQRQVLVSVALNDVPIDVLAERLETSRGALYKTLHDARKKLRAALDDRGLEPVAHERGQNR